MEISLLLKSVSQDQVLSNDDIAFSGWMHGPSSGGNGGDDGKSIGENRLPKYSLRNESWGGVLVFGPTQSVYQLDNDAYELMLVLKNSGTLDKFKENSQRFEAKKVQDFVELVSELKLV